jgi:hypothetical protein
MVEFIETSPWLLVIPLGLLLAFFLNRIQIPTLTFWNRLEVRPRTEDFDRSLKAEVRDALWMLTRQWQMGEFDGDDAGSPIFAKIHLSTTRFEKFQPAHHNNSAESFMTGMPLETQVEKRPIPFEIGQQDISSDIRLLMGRQWLKMIRRWQQDHGTEDFSVKYIEKYPFRKPDPKSEMDAQICAHIDSWQQIAAVAERAMDGAAFYFNLKSDPVSAHHGVGIPVGLQAGVDEIAQKFTNWFERLFCQPDRLHSAWKPEYLEYQFALSTSKDDVDTGDHKETVFVADEYYHGRLDWYNLDIDPQRTFLGVVSQQPTPSENLPPPTQSFLPVRVEFGGMPHTRWWTFEDRRTNFGDIRPGTTDLAQLLLIEFGLVYANDWFLFQLPLHIGTVTSIEGLVVTNTFGERTWIEAAGKGADSDWARWSMFTLSTNGNCGQPADTRLLLLPTVPLIQEGKPFEEIMLIRDETANMVWGIEKTIPLPDGSSKLGREAALETRRYHQRLIDQVITWMDLLTDDEYIHVMEFLQAMWEAGEDPEAIANVQEDLRIALGSTRAHVIIEEYQTFTWMKSLTNGEHEAFMASLQVMRVVGDDAGTTATIRYELMSNNVPENWIPFLPVHKPGDTRDIQLQRAALPRVLDKDPRYPTKIRPRTVLLREGLDKDIPDAYFIHEEEVPRSGVRVSQSFQRTRWCNGKTFVWLGIRKQAGRGEGSSGLSFDRIVPVDKNL